MSTVDFPLPEPTKDKSALLEDPVFAVICYHICRERIEVLQVDKIPLRAP